MGKWAIEVHIITYVNYSLKLVFIYSSYIYDNERLMDEISVLH